MKNIKTKIWNIKKNIKTVFKLSDFAFGSVSSHARYWVLLRVTARCDTDCPHVARVLPKFKAQYFENV
jgi:hypothetical protein